MALHHYILNQKSTCLAGAWGLYNIDLKRSTSGGPDQQIDSKTRWHILYASPNILGSWHNLLLKYIWEYQFLKMFLSPNTPCRRGIDRSRSTLSHTLLVLRSFRLRHHYIWTSISKLKTWDLCMSLIGTLSSREKVLNEPSPTPIPSPPFGHLDSYPPPPPFRTTETPCKTSAGSRSDNIAFMTWIAYNTNRYSVGSHKECLFVSPTTISGLNKCFLGL